ncbi:MAG: DUF3015 family protein [Bdellovibrionales bacterium]
MNFHSRLAMFFVAVFVFFSIPLAYSFDEEKCGELFPKSGDSHRPYLSPIYSATLIPSTTSYFSSFGKCAMYSHLQQRELFIASSYEQISQEASRGNGEYVSTLATLSGCAWGTENQFAQLLKSHYSQIFRNSHKLDSHDLAKQVDSYVAKDINLEKRCRIVN